MKMFRYIRSCCILRNNYHKILDNKLHERRHKAIRLLHALSEFAERKVERATGSRTVDGISPLLLQSKTAEYWRKEITSPVEEINWDELFKNFKSVQEPSINTHAIIATLCHRSSLYDRGVSFFKYLYDKRELTPGMLHLFCSMMEEQIESYKELEHLIYNIFVKVKDKDILSARSCSKILLQSPKYWKSVLALFAKSVNDIPSCGVVVLSLMEAKKFNEAINLFIHSNNKQYFVSMEIMKKFLEIIDNENPPVSVIERFLKSAFHVQPDVAIPDEYFDILKYLFQKLQEIDDKYIWSVEKGCLNGHVCSVCNGKLKVAHMTAKEVNDMRKDMEESVIFQDNIYINSNKEEWSRFQKIVQQSNYNIVLDGLNICNRLKSLSKLKQMFSDLKKMELSPFTLARNHLKDDPEYKMFLERGPVFLTDNLSDDDVFILYAALRKGKGCYVLSNDKMRFCNSRLSTPEAKEIYKSWQATHQFTLSTRGHVLRPPYVLSGSYQCTNCQEDEFRYHIINNSQDYPIKVICISKTRRNHGFRNRYDRNESSVDNEKLHEYHRRQI